MGLTDAELGDELVWRTGIQSRLVSEVQLFGGWS